MTPTEPRNSSTLGLVPAHILGGQARVREAGCCGELSEDLQEMCVREAGHDMPHGDGGSAWVPTQDADVVGWLWWGYVNGIDVVKQGYIPAYRGAGR